MLEELKRRKVVRVLLVYAATAFAVLEAADVIVPHLELPDWSVTLILVLLGLGLPVAVVLAWAYDLGPGGVTRTDRDEDPAPAPAHGWLSARTVLGAGALVALGLLGGWWAGRSGAAGPGGGGAETVPRSVAVLPFDNLSGDPSNEYFSDGLAEEILNVLAKVEGLKVAARTSSFAYRDSGADARAIGDALGVGTLLEGSVRKDGERVRVTAQLIKTSDGFHLWSETYERELSDVFRIQEDVARRIVDALQVTLGAGTSAVARERPTEDMEAYQLFLQARHLFHQRTGEALYRSIELYELALERDPAFAEAMVGLAMTYTVLPGYAEPEYDTAERARAAAERALELDPSLALGHAVLANLAVDEARFVDAAESYRAARALDPDDPTILLWSAILELFAGHVDRAAASLEQALDLDPASGVVTGWNGHVAVVGGDTDRALDLYRRSMDVSWGAGRVWLCHVATAAGRREGLPEPCAPAAVEADADITERARATLLELAETGDPEVRRRILDDDGLGALLFAPAWDAPDAFFAALGRTLDTGVGSSLAFASIWRPEAARFRRDPRFADWAERVGLVAYWDVEGWPDACERDASGRVVCG